MSTSGTVFPYRGVEWGHDEDGHLASRAVDYPGLTKREYFAASILQGMAASDYWADNFIRQEAAAQAVADVAVYVADRFIAALNEPQP